MKRFSVSEAYFKRIAQSTVDPITKQPWGGQWDPEQRKRMIPWEQDQRFKVDPESGTVFFDEMPLSPEEISEMQKGFSEDETINSEIPAIGKKLGIEATEVNQLVYPIVEKMFAAEPGKEISKDKTKSYVKDQLANAGASLALQTNALDYLENIFYTLHTLERAEHIRQKSIKALRMKKISAATLFSYYKLFNRKGQVEEEWNPTPSELRTMKRMDRVWALQEMERLKSGKSPEEFYGEEYTSDPFPLLTQEDVTRILKDTREHEDFVVPYEDIKEEENEADVVV